jgi:hypothetical protein
MNYQKRKKRGYHLNMDAYHLRIAGATTVTPRVELNLLNGEPIPESYWFTKVEDNTPRNDNPKTWEEAHFHQELQAWYAQQNPTNVIQDVPPMVTIKKKISPPMQGPAFKSFEQGQKEKQEKEQVEREKSIEARAKQFLVSIGIDDLAP